MSFHDDFNGTDGADWDSTNWQAAGGTGTSTIDGNRGKMTTSTVNGENQWSGSQAIGVFSDFDYTVSFTPLEIGNSLMLAFRTDATHSTGYRVLVSRYAAANKYAIQTHPAGVQIGSIGTHTTNATAKQWVRIQCIGSILRAKVWLDGAAEPAWGIDTIDAAVASGRIALGMYPESPGGFVTTIYWDDLQVSALDAPAPPVSFVAAGAFATSATQASIGITAPACAVDDILIAQLINKSVTTNTISAPDGTWTQIMQGISDCTVAADDHEYALFWKRATASGGSFTFTKATDDNVLFGGVISAWRGCPTTGSPIDATTPIKQTNAAAADNVTFPAFDPVRTDTEVIFFAWYGNDATTFAAAMSVDTNPDCTTRYDLETATGTDATLACTSGPSNGAAITSRTWASASTADAGSTGAVLALIPIASFTGVAPTITSSASTTFTVGSFSTFTVTATGTSAPIFYRVGTLPDGVQFVDGVLSGTPAAGTAGTYPFTITAVNGTTPDSAQSFTLTVSAGAGITGAYWGVLAS